MPFPIDDYDDMDDIPLDRLRRGVRRHRFAGVARESSPATVSTPIATSTSIAVSTVTPTDQAEYIRNLMSTPRNRT